MHKKFSLLILALMVTFSFSLHTSAETTNQVKTSNQIEGVLVVDISNSMEDSDKNKVSNEAMKMFIDMASVSGDKIGVVAYTDEVIREKALVKMRSEQDKNDLKDFIDSLGRFPYTDISVGVNEAVNILDAGHEDGYYPLIVLLADGNNDLNDSKSRTQADSDKDLKAAVEDAKAKGYPIYTIGLNADGTLNQDVLKQIATKTNGKFFETSTADNLPAILSEIFADHLKLKVVPVDRFKANGDYQDITINIPNENVIEANISIMSKKPVDLKLIDPAGKEQPIPSDAIHYSKSKSYSMLKLTTPSQGDWTLKVKGVKEDQIDINLVFNYDLKLSFISPSNENYQSGEKVDIKALFEEDGESISDQELYKSMKATLFVTDVETGDVEEVPLSSAEGFTGSLKIGGSSSYQLVVKAEDNSFYRETEPLTINVAKKGASKVEEVQKEEPQSTVPWVKIIVGVLAVLLLAFIILYLLALRKKANRGFSGQIVIEIKDEDTGERLNPHYKKLNQFKGKFNLHQLLSLAPELAETNQIVFKPGKSDDLILYNQSNLTIEKSGRAIDASNGLEIKRNDRLRIVLKLVNKSIYVEYIA